MHAFLLASIMRIFTVRAQWPSYICLIVIHEFLSSEHMRISHNCCPAILFFHFARSEWNDGSCFSN